MAYPFDLGGWSRPVATRSKEAQVWFDRGINWTYGYNQEEAVACFRRAIEADPDCAMAWWGVAYANGPFYNRPWIRFTDAEIDAVLPTCVEAAAEAARRVGDDPVERALAEAIPLRYPEAGLRDRDVLNGCHRAFAEAMLSARAAHPADLDLAALAAEAAITATPRQLWDLSTGAPKEGAMTEAALAVLNDALARADATGVIHPGLLHIHIHALEMSPEPEAARGSADRLRGLVRDAGHLEHMAAHIDVLCGDYAAAVDQSLKAIAADDRYLAEAGPVNFYTTARCHDFHLLMYAAMFLGRFDLAIHAADRIRDEATPELIAASPPYMASILDGYAAMRTHVLVRFGRWRELIEEPPPAEPAKTPILAALRHYGAGVAHAAMDNPRAATKALAAYRAAASSIPEEAIFLSNPVRTMLAVGEAMLEGELAFRDGRREAAFEALRTAVARDDALNFTEPWAWMHPPRHALAALLAEDGRLDEAETELRADLGLDDTLPRPCRHPDNIWALTGLAECMRARNAAAASEVVGKLEMARKLADDDIVSACACRRA
ncbi:hypothetical protein G5B40_20015 [Pikeienuella piscinae]|uniref:Tetratricopeptide repeat protein n=1 Tax=Pikeienuella piscinae TaxID=2748098 RepID=A0A7M3T699_9RHOB|nr:hypothetical protein [Pikeienuella piscinae]QIE57530.1 hypothetical protein G5B40_20015 [Pikeienuella piscinae]